MNKSSHDPFCGTPSGLDKLMKSMTKDVQERMLTKDTRMNEIWSLI
jgi:hypothetical protein